MPAHYNILVILFVLALICYCAEISPLMERPKQMIQAVTLFASVLLLLRDFGLI